MSDRYNMNSQQEHLHSRYVGTGHPDITKWESETIKKRDNIALMLGREDLIGQIAMCENKTKAKVRFELQYKMILPCGPPPLKKEEPMEEDN